jgi:dTDP-4-dehydrorhamnose reductase
LKVFVSGAGGLVGNAVRHHCEMMGDHVFAADHRSLDIADANRVLTALIDAKPDVVINCAAWTDVDGCERDAARAFAANAWGPQNLARASRLISAGFITISTDYVFDGTKQGFYTQRDDPNPQSVYAAAKLEGEIRAREAYARTIIVRSGFIFGPRGKNFLSTVGKRIANGETVKAISDCFGTPTYAVDLAKRLRELSEIDLPGVFHVVNDGNGVSYDGFAHAVSQALGKETLIESVTEDSLKRPAARPRNSRMKCLMSDALGLNRLQSWRKAVEHFVQASHVSV